ncbi:MAG: hypothetical protein CSA01_00255 [Bacteroidetes bacterium]|nr:MAG: hypothetical protein CSA01_00255 [Bacteroidota bacterium]
MTITEVLNLQDENKFIKFPLQLYKNNKYWIRPLDKDIASTFDPKKNTVARADNHKRWLLYDNNQVIGRIAAFVNDKTKLKNNDYPVGGMGFFECIDNQNAANLLFDTAKNWLETQGMEAMEGPVNFGDRDKFWGLLVHGFDFEPNYLANYNPPYYQQLMENYGFKLYFNQFTFRRPINSEFTDQYYNKGKAVLDNPDFHFTTLKKKQLDKFTEDFRLVYNKAWARHEGVAEMKPRQAKAIMKSLKPVLDEKIAYFAYHKETPIAFFINIPEVNQIFKHVNGHMNLWGKLTFLKHKLLKTNTKMLGIVFGVAPEFDGKGVSQAITIYAAEVLTKYTNYKFLEMHGIGDFNPGMLMFVSKLGLSDKNKIHTTYRYIFDRDRPYERMPLKSNKPKTN